jgi:hypothetical protein
MITPAFVFTIFMLTLGPMKGTTVATAVALVMTRFVADLT